MLDTYARPVGIGSAVSVLNNLANQASTAFNASTVNSTVSLVQTLALQALSVGVFDISTVQMVMDTSESLISQAAFNGTSVSTLYAGIGNMTYAYSPTSNVVLTSAKGQISLVSSTSNATGISAGVSAKGFSFADPNNTLSTILGPSQPARAQLLLSRRDLFGDSGSAKY